MILSKIQPSNLSLISNEARLVLGLPQQATWLRNVSKERSFNHKPQNYAKDLATISCNFPTA